MITLFQITGSSSFAVRCALECADTDYDVVNVHPKRRSEAIGFAAANPLMRVPALTEGDVALAETGAVLLWIAERFPEAGLSPAHGTAAFADHLRWTTWCANTLHPGWSLVMVPTTITPETSVWPSIEARAREVMARNGTHVEAWLADHEWLAGDRPGVSDIYLYMLVGWGSYYEDLPLGGANLADLCARVGALPGVVRARELDDLDERLIRFHPELRGGEPI